MTKWARMRRRKERKRDEETLRRSEGKEVKLVEPENISENTQHPQKTKKLEATKTFKPNTILSQIPRYVYLLAFFTFLSGIFFPLITYHGNTDASILAQKEALSLVIQGIVTLFLGLAGGILLFKAATSDKRRGVFIVIGFTLMATSLALMFFLQSTENPTLFGQ
jgi:hypothetical protein